MKALLRQSADATKIPRNVYVAERGQQPGGQSGGQGTAITFQRQYYDESHQNRHFNNYSEKPIYQMSSVRLNVHVAGPLLCSSV